MCFPTHDYSKWNMGRQRNNRMILKRISVIFFLPSRVYQCTYIISYMHILYDFPVQLWVNLHTKKFSHISPFYRHIVLMYKLIPFTFLFRCVKIIWCVLSTFSENLLQQSHSYMAVSCSFNATAIDDKFLPDINTLVSSANKIDSLVVDTVVNALMYKKDSNRPKIDPCGTPHFTISLSDFILL